MESNTLFNYARFSFCLVVATLCFGCSEEKKSADQPQVRTNKSISLENQRRVLQARSMEAPEPEKPKADPKQTVDAFRQRLQTITGKKYPTEDELKTKAETGDAEAQVDYAKKLATTGDRVEAMKWYQKAAEQGNVAGQHALGIAYVTGDGVKQDYTEAVKWFSKAADQGDMDSQYALGLRYARGDGVAQDMVQAAKWYALAANQGSMYAQAGLGLRYEKGDGVAADKVEAYKWYDIADKNGHFNAGQSRDKLAANMTAAEIERAQQLAASFTPVKTRK